MFLSRNRFPRTPQSTSSGRTAVLEGGSGTPQYQEVAEFTFCVLKVKITSAQTHNCRFEYTHKRAGRPQFPLKRSCTCRLPAATPPPLPAPPGGAAWKHLEANHCSCLPEGKDLISFMEPVWYVLTKQSSAEITKLEVFLIPKICKPYAYKSEGRFHNSPTGWFPSFFYPEREFGWHLRLGILIINCLKQQETLWSWMQIW